MPDEKLRAHIHDTLVAGGDVRALLSHLSPADAQAAINEVMSDYVVELNRALTSGAGKMYGQDATAFMQQYDTLWQVKLSL